MSNVSNPWKSLIATFLHNLKISHLDSTYWKIRDFKFDLNWNFQILISLFILNGGKSKRCSHQVFFAPFELFDYPNHAAFIWHIFNRANVCFKNRWININRHRNDYFHIICNWFRFKLSFCFNDKFYLWFWKIFNLRFYPNQWLNMGINSVWHKFKFSIWGYKSNQSLCVEFVQSYTLMKLNIFKFYQFISWLFSC